MNNSTTNNSFQFNLCDTFLELDKNENIALRVITTIALDLIVGMLAGALSYRFYQGIDISHPVYAVIFTNILYSTFTSFTSFLIIIIDCFLDSCVANMLNIWLDSACVLDMFLCITLLR